MTITISIKAAGISTTMLANSEYEMLVLLADREASARAELRALLEADGYAVMEAADASACLSALNSMNPELIILGELGSPQSAFHVIEAIKQVGSPSILMMCDESDTALVEQFYEAGIDDHLARPPLPVVLRSRIRRLLDARQVPELQRSLQASEERYHQLLNAAPLAVALRDIGAALNSSLDLETIMTLILNTVGRVVPHDAANIMQIQGSTARVTHLRGYPDRITELMRAQVYELERFQNFLHMAETREPCLFNDTKANPEWITLPEYDWIRAYLGVPIEIDGAVIGFINLDSKTPGVFTQQDIAHLQAFANQVATAIRNAQLYKTLRDDSDELKMLHRATAFLFSTHLFAYTSLKEVGAQIAETVVNEFGQLDCGVMLVDEDCNQLIRLARAGLYGVHTNNTLYLHGAGLVPEAVRTGKLIYAPDVRRDLRYVANDTRTRSELVLPLRTSKGIIGVLDLQSSIVDAFSDQDQRVLHAFSELAAAAMENILLYEQVRRYTLELEERVSERTAELYRAKERVEAILHNSSEAIIMIDQVGAIQQTNRSFDNLFSYPVDGAYGLPLHALVQPDSVPHLEESFLQVVLHKRAARVEVVARTSGGGTFDADLFLSPIAERDQHVSSVVASLRDITARKRMEAELRNALERERELSDMKSRFISTASHEFRTPLSMIMTSTDMLMRYGQRLTDVQKQERVARIQTEVAHLTELLDDLLMLNRAGGIAPIEMNPVPVDFPSLCADIIEEVQTGPGLEHHFAFECRGNIPTSTADPRLLRQILLNLLMNAVKYSLPGTTISFTLYCEATYKVIVVGDEGIGIPEDEQRSVFEAFHRARNVGDVGGTGLGLAIVQHAVNLHSGSITLQSQPGVGTTFTITLPDVAKEK